ncbi:KH domain-containing protein [Drosera capensis]
MAVKKSDESSSTAIEAVLLQEKINEDGDAVSMRLVVPSKDIGCIIGKKGWIINEIRKKTRADIRISKTEQPKFSDSTGERIVNVRDADGGSAYTSKFKQVRDPLVMSSGPITRSQAEKREKALEVLVQRAWETKSEEDQAIGKLIQCSTTIMKTS